MKTLKLTSPYMSSGIVTEVQRRLNLRTDGVYGPVTAGAVKAWKWRTGFHKKFVNGQMTASDYAYMTSAKPRTRLMKIRAKRRVAKVPMTGTMQQVALKTMLAWAKGGLVEDPPRSNVIPRLSTIGRMAKVIRSYYQMGYPYCAYGSMLAALGSGSYTAKAGLVDGKFNPLYVPEIESLARQGKYGMRQVGWGEAKPGDFVIFNWDGGVPDHIGMLVEVSSHYGATCVEANTSPSNAGSQSNGGGVYVRNRDRSQIQSIIRWS